LKYMIALHSHGASCPIGMQDGNGGKN